VLAVFRRQSEKGWWTVAARGFRRLTLAGAFGIMVSLSATAADNYEPNDSVGTAYDLSSNESTWLNTIAGFGDASSSDDDWYEIYVSSGTLNVLVSCLFTHSSGDIDITLYASDGTTQVGSSTSVTDDEYIDVVVPSYGTYYIKVYSWGVAANSYNLWWDDLSYTPEEEVVIVCGGATMPVGRSQALAAAPCLVALLGLALMRRRARAETA